MPRRFVWLPLLALLAAACASTAEPTAPPRPSEGPAARVRVADLAARHGLTESYEVRRNRLLLSGDGGRVLLFPGTTVVVVNGETLPETRRVGGRRGDFTVTADDARKIESALVARREPATAKPLPSAPAAEPAPTEALRPVPAVAAEPGWKVPLRREWRYVVIHHSGTKTGSAKSFDTFHRDERGWDGLGYDFVIGNGQGSGDGQVEVGYRWKQQLTGAHAGRAENGSNLMNETGIGICLVGNFDATSPTPAQLRALHRLVAFLCAWCGIPPENVLVHGDVRDTDCPGKKFPVGEFVVPGRRVPASFR